MQHNLTGRLDMDSCGELAKTLTAMLAPTQALTLDFTQVTAVDSAALSLILELQRAARSQGASLSLVNMPAEIASLATLYGIASNLPSAKKAET
jgi:phospholipid transport system transporter-binding protein